MVSKLLRPWLLLPVSWAHSLSPKFLKYTYNWRRTSLPRHTWQSVQWRHLKFRNPVGLAGGADKNAEAVPAWWHLGAGFVEVGTVTPFAQKSNLGQTVARDLQTKALWNCLGFPNHGAQRIKARLLKLPPKGGRPTPLFINIGKNRWTSNEEAHHDYTKLISDFYDVADAFVINISSPNTKGLRDLFQKDNFLQFLTPILTTYRSLASTEPLPPLFLKLSPDLSEEDLENIIEVLKTTEVRGLILTNTTLHREPSMSFPLDRGGVSGAPLNPRSKKILLDTLRLLGAQRPEFFIISVGGIMNKEDINERLALGADLVQVYSALIFEGLGFFTKVRN